MTGTTSSRAIEGSCHCGNLRYTLFWPGGDGAIPVRACSCSFCRKHGGVHTSHPNARVEIRIADESRVRRYRFGTKTADFHVCLGCGVVPVITGTIEEQLHAVVNVNCFEGIDPSELKSAVADFEGETTESRLERRQRTWIPDVSFG